MASRKAVAFLLANPDIAKAYVEGKPIQFRHKERKYGEEWVDWNFTSELMFSSRYDYRLKPEPKMIYLLINGDGATVRSYPSRAEAEAGLKRASTGGYGPYMIEEYKQVL